MSCTAEMPRYRCHKEIWALKIARVEHVTPQNLMLYFSDAGYAPIQIDHKLAMRYHPKAGDYYVVYKDGYKSFSPADAFEDGYTRI